MCLFFSSLLAFCYRRSSTDFHSLMSDFSWDICAGSGLLCQQSVPLVILCISPSAREASRPRQCQLLVELVRLQKTGSLPLTLMPQQMRGCKVKALTSILEGLRHWNLLLLGGTPVSRTRPSAALCLHDYVNKQHPGSSPWLKHSLSVWRGKGTPFDHCFWSGA